MSDKITVIGPPPYKAWRVNFWDQHRSHLKERIVFSAVVDAPDFHAAWRIVHENYPSLFRQYITRVERELRPPSEWEKS
jgi:hypothetical protein